MPIFPARSPLELPTRLSVVRCDIRPRAGRVAIAVLAILAAFAVRAALAQENSADQPRDLTIGELIRRIRAEEAKYQDLEVVTRRSHQAAPGRTEQNQDETVDSVRQKGLCYAHVRTMRTLNTGDKGTEEVVSAFDGERTRTVEVDNSVNVHLRRYDPSQVVPPHSWALTDCRVNFDLSTFLGGLPAMDKDRKVRRVRHYTGRIFEFWKLEFRVEGEETVDDLRCVKIGCEWWYSPKDRPTRALIWLALDRNLICAKMRQPDVVSVVKEWREIEPGLWLPAQIHSEIKPFTTEDLTLESATPHPDYPAAYFRDVPIPEDLPVYTIDEEGHLADDFLLHATTFADPKRRMQEILAKIRENEALYRSFEASIEIDDRPDVRDASWLRQRKVDVVRQGGRYRLSDHFEGHSSRAKGPRNPTGSLGLTNAVSAFDGTWSRSVQLGELGAFQGASMQPADNFAWSEYSPHLLLLCQAGLRMWNNWGVSLVECLTAEGADSMGHQWKNKVTYLGSEMRDGLACDIVELVSIFGGRANENPRELIWLAKDRNYLPVRWEWRNPRQTLPRQFARTVALAEVKPGVWFPQRIEVVTFLGAERDQERLIINERRDTVVRSFGLEPKRPDSEFHDVVVRAHMSVYVIDAAGKGAADFRPEETGVVTFTDAEWTRLVLERLQNGLKYKYNEWGPDREKRLAIANAWIGKSPPELPRTWVNGKTIDWKDLKGKPVLLLFWAVWHEESCNQAKRLSDQVERLEAAGITVVGAHPMGTPAADVERVVKQFNLKFPVCIDPSPGRMLGGWGPLWTQLAVRTLPTAFVIDATGHVADFGAIDTMAIKARELALRKAQ